MLVTSIIVDIALASTWQPGMLVRLHRDYVTNLNEHGDPAFRKTAQIAAPGGGKTAQAEVQVVRVNATEETIWRRSKLGGLVCVYDDMKRYLECTKYIDEKNFFLSVNYLFNLVNFSNKYELRTRLSSRLCQKLLKYSFKKVNRCSSIILSTRATC